MSNENKLTARQILISKKKSKGIPLVKYMPINTICEAMQEYSDQEKAYLLKEIEDLNKEIDGFNFIKVGYEIKIMENNYLATDGKATLFLSTNDYNEFKNKT